MAVARSILIVDHGSRLAAANQLVERVAEQLQRRLAERGEAAPVHVAHLEIASPDFAEGLAACLTDSPREVVVMPFFLAPGRHGTRDIPALVAAARERHPEITFRTTGLLGDGDALADVVLTRLDEMDGGSEGPDAG